MIRPMTTVEAEKRERQKQRRELAGRCLVAFVSNLQMNYEEHPNLIDVIVGLVDRLEEKLKETEE